MLNVVVVSHGTMVTVYRDTLYRCQFVDMGGRTFYIPRTMSTNVFYHHQIPI